MIQRSSGINAFNIADAMYGFMKNQRLEDGDQYYDENKMLILKEVNIKDVNTNTNYNLSHYVLFVDQIIGFYPGDIIFD